MLGKYFISPANILLEIRFHDGLFIRKRRSSLNQIDSRGGGRIYQEIVFTTIPELLKPFHRKHVHLKRASISLHLQPGFSFSFNFLLQAVSVTVGPFSFYRGTCVNVCRFLRAVRHAMKKKKKRENERLILRGRVVAKHWIIGLMFFCSDLLLLLLLLYMGINGRVGQVHSFFFSFFKWIKDFYLLKKENDVSRMFCHDRMKSLWRISFEIFTHLEDNWWLI